MLFGAFLGEPRAAALWQTCVEAHAAWRRIASSLQTFPLATEEVLCCGWLGLQKEDRPWKVDQRSLHLASMPGRGRGVEGNEIDLRVDCDRGEVRIEVPLTAPEPCFWTRGPAGLVLSNDFQLLIRWGGFAIDDDAACALLQSGAIPAPLTLARSIARVPPGHVLHIDRSTERLVPRLVETGDERDATIAEERVGRSLDETLESLPRPTVLYFSGGVDSALLAARLVELGRKDVTLWNFSFHADDPESAVAAAIAAELGMKMRRATQDEFLIAAMLGDIGRDYTFPFADFSSIPTNLLVRASLADAPASAVEGTGADGAFAVGANARSWGTIARTPVAFRRLIADVLGHLRPWRFTEGLDRLWRVAARSTQMPLAQAAVLAQDAYRGVLLDIPAERSRRLNDLLSAHVESLLRDGSLADRICLLDLVHVCAAQFAPKSFDVLRLRGVRPIYPFLEGTMVRTSLGLSWDCKCEGEPKGLLKRMLTRRLPRELVYRRKSGFRPPLAEMMCMREIQGFVRDALNPRLNPLLNYCRRDRVTRVFDDLLSGRRLAVGALWFVWGHVFTTRWLSSIRDLTTSPSMQAR